MLNVYPLEDSNNSILCVDVKMYADDLKLLVQTSFHEIKNLWNLSKIKT